MSNVRYFNEDKPDCNQLLAEKNRLSGRVLGYRKLGMHKEAVDECKKLVRLDYNDPSSFIELGFNCEENGEIEKAIKYYKYAIKRFPDYSCAYLNLGYCFETYKKRNDMAVVCYEKALKLNPADAWALNNIGGMLQKEGRWEEALPYFEKAAESSEKEEECLLHILHNLGRAFYKCKKYQEACDVYYYLVKKDQDKPFIFSEFGCVLYKMGNFRGALAAFEDALALSSDSRHYRRLWRVANQRYCFCDEYPPIEFSRQK